MFSLKSCSDDSLHSQTLLAAKNEKSATLVLLEFLAEVDRRRLYASRGFSSLWEYVHKDLKYCESQSSERVNAMRLMVKVPEVKEELKAGKLTLTTTAKLASHVKQEECKPAETLELLKEVSGKTSREVEKILASESTQVARPDQIKIISQTATRITIDVDNEFLGIMNRVKDLAGHPGSKAQEIFKIAMKDFVKRREIIKRELKEKSSNQDVARKPAPETGQTATSLAVPSTTQAIKNPEQNPLRAPEVSASQPSRYIPVSVKTKIRIRSGDRCEYISPITKRRCECRTNLEFDHIQAHALHGKSTFENLRHYCRAHNTLAAIRTFGERKMNGFLKTA